MKEVQIEGKTVQLAVDVALRELALRRDQVEVVVLNEGSGGFLGIGAKKACVVVREKKWSGEHKERRPRTPRHHDAKRQDHRRTAQQFSSKSPQPQRPQERAVGQQEISGNLPAREESGRAQSPHDHHETTRSGTGQTPAGPTVQEKRSAPGPGPGEIQPLVESAKSVVSQILTLFGIQFTELKGEWDPRQSRVCVEFASEPGNVLTGRDSRILEALQFLVTLIVSRKSKIPVAIQVDTQNRWKRLESEILEKVTRAVETVKSTGRPYRLEPMSPAIRRFVHKALETRTDVETVSEGESKWRKIVIKPKT